MTGVLNAMVGASNVSRHSVTIGNNLSFYGFGSGFGAVTPSSFRGQPFSNVNSKTQAGDLIDITIVLEGNLPQTFFNALQVQDSTGAIRTYSTATAAFVTFGSAPVLSQWQWDSNNPAWTSTSPSPRSIALF